MASRIGAPAPAATADPTFRVHLAGEIDMARHAELLDIQHSFAGADACNAVVDLRDVSFMDSTGLGLLASLHRTCLGRGGHVTVLNPDPIIVRVLEIAGFTELMEIATERDPRGSHRDTDASPLLRAPTSEEWA